LDGDETVNLIERTLFVSTKARLDRAFLLRTALSRFGGIMATILEPRRRGIELTRNHHVECSLT
jgi:hypothetical protein